MEGGRQAALRGVLFSDMVGSTELRTRLGDDRADAIRRDCYALIGSAVTTHGGRILRWTGDGAKADFPTASAAVAAAIDMQRAVAAYCRSAEAVCPFDLRIGVSVGEVVVEAHEAHGLAVVEAARLEPMAQPGEILATDLVRRLGARRADARFEEVGSRDLKGLDEPVTVVRVVDTASEPAARPFARALSIDRRFPLVGRTSEMSAATEAWHAASRGAASVVLVSGAPGMGKSRLLAQVADLAHTQGALVLAGSCDADLALPYQPFVTAFSAPDLDDELTAAVTEGLGALGPLFPSRRSSHRDDPGPAARFELFQAVVALVDRLADPDPVVLVLDDLHWANGPTVQLLRHLLANATNTRLLVLGGYRAEEVGPGHPLRDLLAEHRRSSSVTRLALGPLTPSDLDDLVSAQVPHASDDRVHAFTRRLYDEGAGSPFFTCELLHHLAGSSGLDEVLDQAAVDDLPIPDSVRDVVDHRLARLPEGDAALLTTAAVVGATFDIELLAALVDRSTAEVLATCEELARMALVQEVDAGRFAFAHAIVRSTVLERVGASRRALAHRRVAEAIEALGRADHDDLAHHWMRAGDEERANASLERAAQRDLDALAFESAADRYQSLLDYHGRQEHPDRAATARALLGVGVAKRALGLPEYFADVERAGRLGRRQRDVDIVAEAAIASIWPGNFFATAGTVNTPLVELVEDALALVDRDDPRRVRLLATLAAHLSFDPDRPRREAILAEAEAEARRIGDPDLIGTALTAEYLSLWNASTSGRRSEIAGELRRLARASGNVDHEFLGSFFTAIGDAEQGRVAAARARLEGLGDVLTASQNFYFGFLTERLLVSLDLLRGEPEMARRVDELADRYADTHADTAGTWAVQAGYLAMQAGTFGSVAPPMLAPMVQGTTIGANWVAPYGLALLHAGDEAGAAEVLDRFEEPAPDYFWLTTLQLASELAAGLGRVDRCKAFFDDLAPHRDELGIVASGSLCYGLVATTLGQLALVAGQPDEAVDLLEDAVERAQAMGAPFETVKARRLLVGALRAAGRPAGDVEAVAARALAEAREHGFAEEEALLSARR